MPVSIVDIVIVFSFFFNVVEEKKDETTMISMVG